MSDVKKSVREFGYSFLPEYLPHLSGSDAFKKLGFIDSVDGLNDVQNLKPQEVAQAPPNTYSGTFGKAEFPLHTDLAHWAVPPRFLALRCIRGSESVKTRLFDAKALINEGGNSHLRRVLVQPRRPMRSTRQLLHILEKYAAAETYFLRWDSAYLVPATSRSKSAFEALTEYFARTTTNSVILAEQGDTLIIDNWRILHGRAEVPIGAASRHIQRAYLKELI